MTLLAVRRRPRLWFLLLSGLALFELARAIPELHRQFVIARHGVRTVGWVTGKGDEKSKTIYYGYRVNSQVFGGQFKLSSLDSDFELTYHDEAVNVIYLRTEPHISEVGDALQGNLRVTQVLCILWLILFFLGLSLSGVVARERRIPVAASSNGQRQMPVTNKQRFGPAILFSLLAVAQIPMLHFFTPHRYGRLACYSLLALLCLIAALRARPEALPMDTK